MTENNVEQISQAELSKKTEAINQAFLREKQAGNIEQITPEERDSKIEEMVADIPREELKQEARELIKIIQESNRDEKTKLRMAERVCQHILLSYMDNRDYLGMPNREFAEYKIYRFISESLDQKKLSVEDLYKMARINFDLNGLKVMNDVGGHSRGNTGLLIFGAILREGKTSRWLKEQGIEVTASAEGGDEFGLIVYGNKDLRPLLPEIEKRFIEEVSSTRTIQTIKITKETDSTGRVRQKVGVERSNVDDIIKFNDPNDLKKLRDMGIINDTDKQLPKDFKFQLGTSVGSSTLGESLNAIGLEDAGGYREMIKRIIEQMFLTADTRAIINKDEGKKRLEIENPTLYRMFNRVSKEVVELNKQITELAKQIEKLKALNEIEHQKRAGAEQQFIKLKSQILKLEMGRGGN